MSLTISDWVKERLENCTRIAATKKGEDRAGWLEDAKYFAEIYAIVSASEAQESPAAEPDWTIKCAREIVAHAKNCKGIISTDSVEGLIADHMRASTAPGWIADGTPVYVDNPQFTGYGIAQGDSGSRKRVISVQLENGNTWNYDADTVRNALPDEYHKMPRAIQDLAAPPAPHKET